MGFEINSKIVLSFAMKDGGHSFSTWLWYRLKREYGLHDPLAVYLDTMAARHIPLKRELDLKAMTYKRPTPKLDTREAVGTSGRFAIPRPIGLMRKDWDSNFRLALASAQAMVVVLDRNYGESVWCMQEVRQARDESMNRAHEGRRPIKIVVLDLNRSPAADGPFANDTVIAAERVPGKGDPLLFAAGEWKVSDEVIGELKRAVGPLH